MSVTRDGAAGLTVARRVVAEMVALAALEVRLITVVVDGVGA